MSVRLEYLPITITDEGYIRVDGTCWHKESRLNRWGEWGPAGLFAIQRQAAPFSRLADAVANMEDDEGAVLCVRNGEAVAVWMLPERRSAQQRRLNFWRGCYGTYKRLSIRRQHA